MSGADHPQQPEIGADMTNNDDADVFPLIDTGLERLLADCRRAYELGFTPALYEALCLCKEHENPIPDWVREAAIIVLAKIFTARGSPPGVAKLVGELKHYERWIIVNKVRAEEGLSWSKVYPRRKNIWKASTPKSISKR